MVDRLTILNTALVVAHAIVAALHGWAHQQLDIYLSWAGNVFVYVVIVLGPILGAVLLWTHRRAIGALVIAASMFGSLAFGVYNHFIAMSNDHVSSVPEGTTGTIFVATAWALAALELASMIAALWAWRRWQSSAKMEA